MAAVVTYSKYALKDDKTLAMVRYKEVVDAALTAGKTAAELIAAAPADAELPAVEEIKSLKTRVCKDGDKFVVLASVRYIG